MNSLYGRFGINPRSTITEVCLEYRYNYLIRNSELIFIEKLNELYYVISYWDNPGNYCWKGDPSERWNPPRISAIQLAAAITASARIYMYPFISREDCYYTDTDSVVLGQPLPEEWISSSTLEEGDNVLKHKGAAKAFISKEWFESQYQDLSRTEQIQVSANFRIDYKSMNITRKNTMVRLGIKEGTKRKPVYDENIWVDTEPIEITDLGKGNAISHISQMVIKSLKRQILQLRDENTKILSKMLRRKGGTRLIKKKMGRELIIQIIGKIPHSLAPSPEEEVLEK
ncbi:UNVERIFIED_CONTAM: DNA polymerase [Sesamum calycinum]|uniref:DNA-directed DNA polymerase n=1 Tax=Sesamum calycinum TaxID=2727403 RepID=A0AAW2KF53_9LAMI